MHRAESTIRLSVHEGVLVGADVGVRPIEIPGIELREMVGMGASASVWRAQHIASSIDVAVKLLKSGTGREQALHEAELRSLGLLDSPYIVRVHGHGRLRAGGRWLLTEWCGGGPIASVHDFDTLASIAVQVLRALQHAHARGVLHRDVKPANVLRDHAGNAKLADFGLASHLGRATVHRVGSPAFMSPEAVQGHRQMQGPWTDLYSLAAMLWLLATRAPIVHGSLHEQLRQQVEDPLPHFEPVFAVPPAFEAWLRRLLEKEPTDRPANAAEDLDGFAWPDIPSLVRPQPGRSRAVGDQSLTLARFVRPPLIGRDAEMQALQQALQQWLQTGNGTVLELVGPDGIGRRRLAEELAIDAHERGIAVWKGFEHPHQAEELEQYLRSDSRRPRIALIRTDEPVAARLLDVPVFSIVIRNHASGTVPAITLNPMTDREVTALLANWVELPLHRVVRIVEHAHGLPGAAVSEASASKSDALPVTSAGVALLAWADGIVRIEDWETAHHELGTTPPWAELEQAIEIGAVRVSVRRDGAEGLVVLDTHQASLQQVDVPRALVEALARTLGDAPEATGLLPLLGRADEASQRYLDSLLANARDPLVPVTRVARAMRMAARFALSSYHLWSWRGLMLMVNGNHHERSEIAPVLVPWVVEAREAPPTGLEAARFWYGVGVAAFSLLRDDLIDEAQERLVGLTDRPIILGWRCHLASLARDYDHALELVDALAEQEGHSPRVVVRRAFALMGARRYEACLAHIETFQSVPMSEASRAELAAVRGSCLVRLRRLDEAIEVLSAVLRERELGQRRLATQLEANLIEAQYLNGDREALNRVPELITGATGGAVVQLRVLAACGRAEAGDWDGTVRWLQMVDTHRWVLLQQLLTRLHTLAGDRPAVALEIERIRAQVTAEER